MNPSYAIEESSESITCDRGMMRAFWAAPQGEPPEQGRPGVVVIHDAFGFSDDVRRIARRFASSGYVAVAPALYDTSGAGPLCVVRTFGDLQRRKGPAFERIDATRDALANRRGVAGGRIGITGFCMGGGFALFYAARPGSPVQVCAPYYGDTPKSEEALRGVCPVVAGYGALDEPYARQGRRLEQHLESLGIPHDIKIYPNVGHSYMNRFDSSAVAWVSQRSPLHAGYDEEAAEDSWRRMLSFFEEHLGA